MSSINAYMSVTVAQTNMMLERFVYPPPQLHTAPLSSRVGSGSEARRSTAKQSTGYSRHIYAMARPRLIIPPRQANGVLSPVESPEKRGRREGSWRRSQKVVLIRDHDGYARMPIVFRVVMVGTKSALCAVLERDVSSSSGLFSSNNKLKGVEAIVDLSKDLRSQYG
jgi:hypothetical protein